uniref:ATP synthase complex subunit 8 n=1 Tax=Conocephalus maculatus TaxID=578476 RepID=G9BYX7_9ORTH|nr:ATP synthase F0 subunit 8 [Conocephalus maculatus]ADW26224.1 ATP synthase F0 subunit 8 [Conocephalus maculatus]AIW64923.1 ATP synthase F0 subunit 8 [Conocephalus maculatus]
MPQMAPMSWLFLFLMFSFALILFNMLKFPMISMQSEMNEISTKTSHTLNWKW